MGHKHTKAEILDGALAAAFDDGLSQLTFGRVAKRLGISDRIVVYYFPTKDDLIGEVLYAMGAELQATLAPTFTTPAADHLELLRTAWPILARTEADPVFALFFEAGGLAATGREPFRPSSRNLMDAWIEWAAAFIDGTTARRRAEAEAAIAMLDGLLLMRQLVGPKVADRAARKIFRGARQRCTRDSERYAVRPGQCEKSMCGEPAVEPAGQPPGPLAEHPEQRRDEHHSDHGGVEQDRQARG